IIFTSDNGGNMYNDVDGTTPTSNAPLRGGKATLFEGGTRVPGVIVWPGIAAAGSRSDAIVQSEDYYPTLLDGLGLNPAPDQQFDGISILPALRGDELTRDAVFQYFPHNPGVPDWLPPAVSVHRGDWKLIRIFHGGENGAHRHLLFNLRDDLGEKHDLAAREPEWVRELDSLISQFLSDTKAVVPVPNPAFDPAKYRPELEGKQKPANKPAAGKPAKDDGDPALQGWKARNCAAAVNEGIVTVTGLNNTSFLGFAAGRHSGPSTLKLRVKASGGTSHVDWLPGGAQGQSNSVPFTFPKGEWAEIAIEIPATGPLGIVRIYLPQQAEPVEIDWIEITSTTAKPTRTEF
ncbi:MAG: N-acetylgalactosamine 6-sulfate sulfatase (GALNS), partial [Planctomycetes bacterium]|nr:N-acetylgalactosamine 6-sulfate sulfatase (GALNS) [Planctomycetota bacterium]